MTGKDSEEIQPNSPKLPRRSARLQRRRDRENIDDRVILSDAGDISTQALRQQSGALALDAEDENNVPVPDTLTQLYTFFSSLTVLKLRQINGFWGKNITADNKSQCVARAMARVGKGRRKMYGKSC